MRNSARCSFTVSKKTSPRVRHSIQTLTISEDIVEYFLKYGAIDECKIYFETLNKKGSYKGFGFVLFRDKDTMQTILDQNEYHTIKDVKFQCKPILLKDELVKIKQKQDPDQEDKIPKEDKQVQSEELKSASIGGQNTSQVPDQEYDRPQLEAIGGVSPVIITQQAMPIYHTPLYTREYFVPVREVTYEPAYVIEPNPKFIQPANPPIYLSVSNPNEAREVSNQRDVKRSKSSKKNEKKSLSPQKSTSPKGKSQFQNSKIDQTVKGQYGSVMSHGETYHNSFKYSASTSSDDYVYVYRPTYQYPNPQPPYPVYYGHPQQGPQAYPYPIPNPQYPIQ